MKKLKDLKDNETIKLGTQYGAGFIYAGKVKDMDEQDLRVILKAQERKFLFNLILQLFPPDGTKGKKAEHTLQTIMSFITFVPPLEREIVEMYPSVLEKGVKIVIIRGAANGRIAMLDDSPKPIKKEDLHYDECLALLAAIWRSDVEELVRCYERMITGKGQSRELAGPEALSIEHKLDSATGIIRKARQVATNNVCFDEMGRQIRPPKKVYEIIKRRMEILEHEYQQATAKEAGEAKRSRSKILQAAAGKAGSPE